MGIVNIFRLREALSGSAPSAADEGVPIDNVRNYRIILSANSGQTLSGAGTFKFYHWNVATGWAYDPRLDGSVTASGLRSILLAENDLGPGVGRMRVVFTGLTTSDSQPVDVQYQLGN